MYKILNINILKYYNIIQYHLKFGKINKFNVEIYVL